MYRSSFFGKLASLLPSPSSLDGTLAAINPLPPLPLLDLDTPPGGGGFEERHLRHFVPAPSQGAGGGGRGLFRAWAHPRERPLMDPQVRVSGTHQSLTKVAMTGFANHQFETLTARTHGFR